MHKVLLHDIAAATLKDILEKDKKSFEKLRKAIDELAALGISALHVKKLKGTRKIYRKRLGRWRILFTIENLCIHIWVVAVEKDARKDYNRWVQFISYHIE